MMLDMAGRFLLKPAVVLFLAGVLFFLTLNWLADTPSGPGETPRNPKTERAQFVGGQVCIQCHQDEYRMWRESHHDLAMQVADEAIVLGNFNRTSFQYGEITSTFFKRSGKFFVRTDGADGELHEFPIAYTLGAVPLQQYLVAFPDGRYQALSVCWDSRSDEEGGQRWFHLYPGEQIDHQNPLHWTGPYQNWNHMCAHCHATNLRKNYVPDEDRFETDWSDLNVSCESCHGPGSLHVGWARQVRQGETPPHSDDLGLTVQLYDHRETSWVFDPGSSVARRRSPRISHTEVETCARCHSHRVLLNEDGAQGQPLLDTHRPSLLEENLYFADGQIREEVYVYGSFLQSKMYAAGVTCGDCHQPHSLTVYGSGNRVCARCHLPETFDTATHHFHERGSAGAQCVECHMPSRTYMVVDPRRDHSFRIPRPDLSVRLGTPNACTGCHTDRSPQWASAALLRWYGSAVASKTHFGEALYKGRTDAADAEPALLDLAANSEARVVARASALALLARHATLSSLPILEEALKNRHALIRLASVRALRAIDPARCVHLASPLLRDPIRAIRLEAVPLLAGTPRNRWSEEDRSNFATALAEYETWQRGHADRAESHLSLGQIYQALGRIEEAENAYRTALKRDSPPVAASLLLADLLRLLNRDREAETLVKQALKLESDNAEVHYALGLLRVRQRRYREAIALFRQATRLDPGSAHYAYVLGIALHSSGAVEGALEVLEQAHRRHPEYRDLLSALATIKRDRGELDSSLGYARAWLRLSPQDAAAQQLIRELESAIRLPKGDDFSPSSGPNEASRKRPSSTNP